MRASLRPTDCPCDPTRRYSQCCEPLHQGRPADTAEALMRSRYSAYVLGLEGHLLNTWDPQTRPHRLDLTEETPTKWLGLKVREHRQDGDTATVSFIARYRIGGGSATRLQENSRFRREQGRWFYIDGTEA